MSHKNEAPIYTQDDMDGVLAKLRAAEKESEQARQLLWAAVDAAGGEIAISHRVWIEIGPDDLRELMFWDDPITFTMHLKIRHPQAVDK